MFCPSPDGTMSHHAPPHQHLLNTQLSVHHSATPQLQGHHGFQMIHEEDQDQIAFYPAVQVNSQYQQDIKKRQTCSPVGKM
jgi:hypothetical protein